MNHPPHVVEFGEEMHRRMLERGLADVVDGMGDDLANDEIAILHMEIGVASGINAALLVLLDMGLLQRRRSGEFTTDRIDDGSAL